MASIGPDFEMGSLRVDIVKLPWVWDDVAAERAWGEGKGSLGEEM